MPDRDRSLEQPSDRDAQPRAEAPRKHRAAPSAESSDALPSPSGGLEKPASSSGRNPHRADASGTD
jgi:hypothetical protein